MFNCDRLHRILIRIICVKIVKSLIGTVWRSSPFSVDLSRKWTMTTMATIQQSTIHLNGTMGTNSNSSVTECHLIHCSIIKLMKGLIISWIRIIESGEWCTTQCCFPTEAQMRFSAGSTDGWAYRWFLHVPTFCRMKITLQRHPEQSRVILSVQLALSFSSLHVPDWHWGPPLGSSGTAIHHCPH